MKIPTADYCCCGLISLRIGTLLIGIYSFIGSFGALKNTLSWYYEIEKVMNHPEDKDLYAVKIREHMLLMQTFINLDFIVTACSAILGTILLLGFFYSNRTMLRTWVMGIIGIQLFAIVFNTFMAIMFSEFRYMVNNIAVCFNFYFACVVNGYAQEIIKPAMSGFE